MNVRKIVTSGLQLGIGIGALAVGFPGSAAGVAGSSVTFADALIPNGRDKYEIGKDSEFREQRCEAYESFGSAIEGMFQSASVLMSMKVSLNGYLHAVVAALRAQRIFQEDARSAAASLSAIFIYGSIDTQRAAKQVFEQFGIELARLGASKVGSHAARQIISDMSGSVGPPLSEWRHCAQVDLGLATTVSQ